MCVCIHIYIHTYMCLHTYTFMYICMNIYIYIYIYIYIHTFTYKYVHTYIQDLRQSRTPPSSNNNHWGEGGGVVRQPRIQMSLWLLWGMMLVDRGHGRERCVWLGGKGERGRAHCWLQHLFFEKSCWGSQCELYIKSNHERTWCGSSFCIAKAIVQKGWWYWVHIYFFV